MEPAGICRAAPAERKVMGMPLLAATLGQDFIVESCHLNGDLKHHMDNLGLIPGEVVTPIAKCSGNLIVRVKESRLAINMGIASKIYVKSA